MQKKKKKFQMQTEDWLPETRLEINQLFVSGEVVELTCPKQLYMCVKGESTTLL